MFILGKIFINKEKFEIHLDETIHNSENILKLFLNFFITFIVLITDNIHAKVENGMRKIIQRVLLFTKYVVKCYEIPSLALLIVVPITWPVFKKVGS